MSLCDNQINRELGYGDLEIKRDEGDVSIEPSSVDLHLGEEYGWYSKKDMPIKVNREETYPEYHTDTAIEGGHIYVQPGEFLLAHTQEVVNLPDYLVGYLQGRSSVGRLSLFVENAGLVDAGFHGDLTLELFNSGKNTIALKPGMRICQMTIHEHDESPNVAYSKHNGNKYQGQRGPTPSKLYEDFQ